MTGFQLNDKQITVLKDFLTLKDKELKVFLALLSLGNTGTLGQISMLSGLDIISTQQNLQVLSGRGFIKTVPGLVSRYYALEPFLESYIRMFDPDSFSGLLEIISKSLIDSKLSLIDDETMFKEYIGNTLQKQKEEYLHDVEKEQREIFEPLLDKMIDTINSTAFSIIQDIEKRGSNVMKKSANQFQKTGASILAAISETQTKLKQLFEISHQFSGDLDFSTDLFVGESAILLAMRDFIPRTQQYILVFMPLPEVKSLLSLVDLSHRRTVEIDVIGNLKRTPKTILNKVKSEGIGVKLHHDENIDFWGVLKDDNEILLAPIPEENKTITGIYTTSSTIINFFTEHLKKYAKFEPNI
ncbi:MAG: hypothetical protein ACXAC7_11100 [Candidatus Hodarchaeales archaeon]